jgi:ATP-dependent Lon protease
MTGEISLRGRILPVGGIKEKVLAVRAAGIETVLLPEQNRPEFEEIPAHVTEGLRVEYYSEMMELLKRTVPRAFESNTGSAGQTGYSMQASRRDEW